MPPINLLVRKVYLIVGVLCIWELILGLHGGLITIAGVKIRYLLFVLLSTLFIANKFAYPKKPTFKIDKAISLSMHIILCIGFFWTAYGILIFNNMFAFSEGIQFVSVIYIYLIFLSFCDFNIKKSNIFLIFQLPLLMLFSSISLIWISGVIFNIDNSWILENLNDSSGNALVFSSDNKSGRFFFGNTILLILSIYIFTIESEEKNILKYYLYFLLYLVSLFAIGSRGIAIGSCVLLLYSFFFKNKKYFSSGKLSKQFIYIPALIIVSTFVIFFSGDFIQGSRFFDSSATGTVESDIFRIEQFSFLIKDFEIHPLFGNGLGHYVSGYLRSDTYPYGYELHFIGLLMKIGIFGILIYFSAYFLLVFAIFTKRSSFTMHVKVSYCITLLSILFLASTNPIIQTPVGYLLLFSPWLYTKLKYV